MTQMSVCLSEQRPPQHIMGAVDGDPFFSHRAPTAVSLSVLQVPCTSLASQSPLQMS